MKHLLLSLCLVVALSVNAEGKRKPRPTPTATPRPSPTPTPSPTATPTPTAAGYIWQTWVDHAPIGMLSLGIGEGPGPTETNPNGWWNGGPVKLGQAGFESSMIARAQKAANNIVRHGGQGVVIWDIEGTPDTHVTTFPLAYIGDPRLLPSRAPEMDVIADEIFNVFKAQGLKPGVCLRQQYINAAGNGQINYPDIPTAVTQMSAKITYAMNRWGCNIFYIDTNDEYIPEINRQLRVRFPQVLMIPEHCQVNAAEFAKIGSTYNTLYNVPFDWPASVLSVYPKAFTVISLFDASQSKIDSVRPQIITALKHGGILMWRASFEDHCAAEVDRLRQQAGTP